MAVKNEFGKFGDMLENTKKKLDSASKEIESAATKSRTIEKKLSKVQELPSSVKPDLIADESFGVPSETFDEDIIVQ